MPSRSNTSTLLSAGAAILLLAGGIESIRAADAKPAAPAEKKAEPTPLKPSEAKDHIGSDAIVTGLIAEVFVTKNGNVYMNFDQAYPKQTFCTWSPSDVLKDLNLDYLKSLQGKEVSITGKIMKIKGEPQIMLVKRGQLKP